MSSSNRRKTFKIKFSESNNLLRFDFIESEAIFLRCLILFDIEVHPFEINRDVLNYSHEYAE